MIVGGGLNVTAEGVVSINDNYLFNHFYTKGEIDGKNFYAVKEGEEAKVLTTYDFNDEYKTKVDNLVGMFDEYKLPVATETTAGIVKVGSGLSVAEDGTVSANILWTKEAVPALNAGEGEGANKYHQWNKVCEVKIFSESEEKIIKVNPNDKVLVHRVNIKGNSIGVQILSKTEKVEISNLKLNINLLEGKVV